MMAYKQEISFKSDGINLRGWLQTPSGNGPFAVVIMAHGMGGSKEWTIPHVANEFGKVGIAAMAFDYRNYGDSDGTPREEVDHVGQIEDWKSAITFAIQQPNLDKEKLGIWGTSLGGRNVLAVAAIDRRVKCVYSQVSPAYLPMEMGVLMSGSNDLPHLLDRLEQDRLKRANGEEPEYIPFGSNIVGQHSEYLYTFGERELRNFKDHMTLRSLEPNLADNILHLMPRISPTPMRLVLVDNDYLGFEAQKALFEKALEPKSLLVFPGHHYSLYTTWKDAATAAARDWFVQHLKPQQAEVQAPSS